MQVLCNYYENVDISMLRSIFHRGGTKRVPRQRIRKLCHDNISVPVAHGDTGAKGSERERVMQDGGVLPATGFPRDCGMETRRNLQ